MSLCSWGNETLGCRISPIQTARTGVWVCPNCNNDVEPGMICVDNAGLRADDNSGFFARFHLECFTLMELYSEEFCTGIWSWPFPIHDAAVEVQLHAKPDWARQWMILYEMTWKYGNPTDTERWHRFERERQLKKQGRWKEGA